MRAALLATLAAAALACSAPPAASRLSALFDRGDRVVELGGTAVGNLAAPAGLHAFSGELRSVPLRWDPLLGGEVEGYAVERAEPGQERFTRIAVLTGRFRTSFVDRGARASPGENPPKGLEDGATYRYRVRAFDSQRRLAEVASEEVTASTAPRPAPPADLRAYSHLPRRVALTWQAAEDASVRRYVVYRSPSAGGEYETIAQLPDRHETQYVDEKLGDLRVFYYRVASVNAAGGEGPPSEPVRAVTKAEPLPPVGLRVIAQRLGANQVAWEPNVEHDVASYRLLRWRPGERTPELVGTLDASARNAWDESLQPREKVTYRLIAADRDGLESDPSDPIRVVSEGYELAARVTEGAVDLSWRDRREEGFVAARVLRSEALRWRELGRVTGTGFRDEAVEPGGRYRYRVILERSDARAAPASGILEVSVPPAPAASAR